MGQLTRLGVLRRGSCVRERHFPDGAGRGLTLRGIGRGEKSDNVSQPSGMFRVDRHASDTSRAVDPSVIRVVFSELGPKFG